MRPTCLTLVPSDILLESTRTTPDTESHFLDRFADHLVMNARAIRAQLTSPVAAMRGGPVDISFFGDITHSLVTLLEATEIAETRITPTFRSLQDLRASRWGFTMQFTLVRFYAGEIAAKMTDPVQKARMQGYVDAMNGPFITAMRRSAPRALVHRRSCAELAFLVADTVGELLRDGQLLSTGLLWTAFYKTVDIYMRIPAFEEGGPPYFRLEEKIGGVEKCAPAL
jgi:hypothetical protein